MRLATLYINGFGLFHDIKIEKLSPEISVFLGDNESGKSTLLGFIRAILFGFPDGRSNENLYPPLTGGRHGGNIEFIVDGKQYYVVERYPGSRGGKVEVLKPDQTRVGKEFLNRFIGIGNRSLFKNIYAFSLSELQDFETLNTESVREALYSAGAGIDPKGLSNLKSTLEKREGELFKPGGVKPKINSILSRLRTIIKEKKSLQGSIDEYDHIRTRISHIIKEIDSLEKRKVDLAIQLKKNEQWINILPEWVNLSLSKEKLNDLDQVDSFPQQGIARLEGLKKRLDDSRNELQNKEEELKRRESDLKALKIDQGLLDNSSSIRQLQKDQGHFEAITRDLLAIKQELISGEQRLKESMSRLGPLWTEEKLLKFDFSIATREEVRNYRELQNQAGLENRRKKDSLEGMISRRREAEESLRDIPEPSIKDSDLLNSMKRSCQKLRNLESRDRLLKEDQRHLDERVNELMEEKGIFDENKLPGVHLMPFWPILTCFGAGLILLAWFGVKNDWVRGFPVIALCFIFGLFLWLLRARMKSADKARSGGAGQRYNLLISKIEELETRTADLNSSIKDNEEQSASLRSSLSMSEEPSEETLEKTYNDINRQVVDDVLLVDDGSRDDTVEIAKKLDIKVIVHPKNMGYGANLKTCFT